jgi:TonB family protein
MSLIVSIARDEPLCIKARADAAAAWGRHEKGYGFSDRGTIAYDGGRSIEIVLNVAVRPNGKFAEFADFPLNLEASGHLTDDDAEIGVFAVKQGKATVAIIVPFLQDELESNVDQAIELDRVVLATGSEAHLRMIVSIKICSAAVAEIDDEPGDAPPLVQAAIPVEVHGTSRVSGPAAGGARASQPFVEETSTAIVFAHGAVVRLAENVAHGQILILRHGNSHEEAACRVVSVKAAGGGQGFVELEFLQPAEGFWGAELPSTNGSKPLSAPAPRAHSVAVHTPAPAAAKPKPVTPIRAAQSDAAPEIVKSSPVAAARHAFSKLLEVPGAIADALVGERPKIVHHGTEAGPSAPVAPAEPVVAAVPVAATIPVAAAEPVDLHVEPAIAESPVDVAEAAAVIAETSPVVAEIETAQVNDGPAESESVAEPAPDDAGAAPIAASIPPEIIESEAAETVEFAAEPAAALVSVPLAVEAHQANAIAAEILEPPSAENAPATAVKAAPSAAEPEPVAASSKVVTAPRAKQSIAPARSITPASGGAEVLSGSKAFAWSKHDERKKSRTAGIAVAAAVVLLVGAGAGLYRWQQVTKLNTNVAAATQPSSAEPTSTAATDPSLVPNQNPAAPAASNAAPPAAPSSMSAAAPSAPPGKPKSNAGGSAGGTASKPSNAAPPAPTARIAPGPEVAEMRMPSPTSATRATAQTAPLIATAVPSAAQGAPASGILSDADAGGPAAPTPVRTSSGAQPARLLSAPPAIYPYGAKAEHVQGDVTVDLLINETGRVASMTVLSGPSLLRDAALEALRQRKYAPAVLDGKAIASHVTVTIHFQL